MEKHGNALRYELAAAILPSRLRRIAMEQPEEVKEHAEEFRLRAGRCMSVRCLVHCFILARPLMA